MKKKMSNSQFMRYVLHRNRLYIMKDPETGCIESAHFVTGYSSLGIRPKHEAAVKYSKIYVL